MDAIEILKSEKKTILDRLKIIDDALALLQENGRKTIKWSSLCVDCLYKIEKPLTSPEILKILLVYDAHHLENKQTKANYMCSLSIALKNLSLNKKVIKIKRIGIKGWYYALPDWFDPKGKLYKKYEF